MNKTQQIVKLEKARDFLRLMAQDYKGYGEATDFNGIAHNIQKYISIFKAEVEN